MKGVFSLPPQGGGEGSTQPKHGWVFSLHSIAVDLTVCYSMFLDTTHLPLVVQMVLSTFGMGSTRRDCVRCSVCSFLLHSTHCQNPLNPPDELYCKL